MRNTLLIMGIVFLLILIDLPTILIGEISGTGNLTVVVVAEDGSTPIEGAVLSLRNVSTQVEILSEPSDKLGEIRQDGLDPGLYLAGIKTDAANFNIEYLIGIRANKTAKVPVALGFNRPEEEKAQPIGNQKKTGLVASLFAGAGFAKVLAASAGAVVSFTKLNEDEREVSAFK